MSWFEKAKTVLIEALDIQDDDAKSENVATAAATTAVETAPAAAGSTIKAKSSPSSAAATPSTVDSDKRLGSAVSPTSTVASSSSFMGAFFDNPNANEMVTTPPRTTLSAKRQSATSDSVDVISSPTSPLDNNVPPIINSDSSLELITATTASEIETFPDEDPSLPNSIVIITSNDTSDIADVDDEEGNAKLIMSDDNEMTEMQHQLNDSTKTIKALPLTESHTADSDSTQSFEDIQMQMSQKIELPTAVAGSEAKGEHSYSSTSSDIEIISNPNGDSNGAVSCVTARISPHKLKESGINRIDSATAHASSSHSMPPKGKGHQREPSEVSLLSEDSQSELDKLVTRISELNQVIEAREQRLLQSERQNAELIERNQELQAAVEAVRKNAGNVESNEAVQRLSALEKKFQASIREREALHIQIKALKDELQNKIPKDELTECNEMIAALQSEGEKLSKEILQQSNIIKKLRAKEKTTDALLKKNAEQISQLSSETDRLKKSLAAKDEVERTQIEAVYKMTSEKRRVDEENAEARNRIEDLQSKLEALQSSFDGVKQDLQQRSRYEEDKLKSENQEYLQQLNDMREKLRITEQAMAKREQQLRVENRELLRRVEAAEQRAESCAQEMGQTTTPLIRQIESLQKVLNQHTSSWNKEEKTLLQKLEESQVQLKTLQHVESVQKEKQELLRTRCNQLEEQLSTALMQVENLKISMSQKELEEELKIDEYKKQITALQAEQQAQLAQIAELKQQLMQLKARSRELEQQTSSSTLTVAAVQAANLQNENRGRDLQLQQHEQQPQDGQHQRSSPTSSIADSYINHDALGGIIDWQTEDLDCVSNSGRQPSGVIQGVHLNFLAHNTTTLEHLQASLKQREGELNHLQWELSRLQAERGALNEEIANLTLQLENAKDQLQTYESMETSYAELQRSYDALMQMYGEKAERTAELELDLVEVRQAYKLQIDELLAQPPPPTAATATSQQQRPT